MKPKIIFLVGPTAVGKTAIAVRLAKKINAEMVSCDAMQIYKGMDIITSKPALSLKRTAPCHLMDIVSVAGEYNVARYRKEALQKIKEIMARGRTPLFVGGTGLYLSVLIDGIFQARSENKSLREQLYEEAEVRGSEYLYQRLKKIDPEAALKIHPHDTKRIIRAIEVFQSTGQPISKLQKERHGLQPEYEIKIFCLNRPRDTLYQRIEKRVEKMFNQGLKNEVSRLLGGRLSRTAACAIGIKELQGYFRGEYDLAEAKRLIKRNSRLYAKRQLTWFRKDKRIIWVEVKEKDKPSAIAKKIERLLDSSIDARDCPRRGLSRNKKSVDNKTWKELY